MELRQVYYYPCLSAKLSELSGSQISKTWEPFYDKKVEWADFTTKDDTDPKHSCELKIKIFRQG